MDKESIREGCHGEGRSGEASSILAANAISCTYEVGISSSSGISSVTGGYAMPRYPHFLGFFEAALSLLSFGTSR